MKKVNSIEIKKNKECFNEFHSTNNEKQERERERDTVLKKQHVSSMFNDKHSIGDVNSIFCQFFHARKSNVYQSLKNRRLAIHMW